VGDSGGPDAISSFLDTDHVIEARAGKTISDIFARREPAFRSGGAGGGGADAAAADGHWHGGGLPAQEGTWRAFRLHALWSACGRRKDLERVRGHDHRPLLDSPIAGKDSATLASREAYYRQADVLVNTERGRCGRWRQHVLHQFTWRSRPPMKAAPGKGG